MNRIGWAKSVLFWAVLGAAGPAAGQSVKAGIEAWQRGDGAAAVAIWRPLAEKGDADAAFNLGQAYRLGRGVALDLPTAHLWLDRAARKGHVDAQATLGLLLFQSGNQAGGMRWLKQAAEGGEARAQLIYGTALFNGDGTRRDPVLGYAFVSRAAAQGLPPAKETLAELEKALTQAQREEGARLARMQTATKASSKPASPAPKSTASRPSPNPAPTRSATAAVGTGGWRIQLGAFKERSAAEALFRRLSSQAPVSGHQPFYVPASGVVRLQVGPFASRQAAAAACAALTRKGQPCFPVAGK